MTAMRWQLFVGGVLTCTAASTLLGACASDESVSADEPDGANTIAPEDAGTGDADAAACGEDCEYFPTTCTPDALCPSGPFDPADPTVGMDWRTRINVIAGRSARDVWIAGAVGAMAHFDGTSWRSSDVGTQESQRILWLLDSAEVSFGSVKRIYTRGLALDADGPDAGGPPSADGWSLRPPPAMPPGFGIEVTSAWSRLGSGSLWLATDSAIWRMRLGSASTFEILPAIPWTVCNVIPCRRMRSLHGVSEKTVWAVGDVGAAIRITDADGASPTATPLNTLTWTGLSGVWAASDTDVWAVGGAGTIRHYTGDPLRWDVVSDVPTNENLNAVGGSSSSDVWAVGNAGVVLHYDGTRWSRAKIAGLGSRRPDLTTVWSPGPGQIWVGGQGVVVALGGKP